ncbi:peptidoglycan-binding protein [Myxococcus sp. K38C18041901]|uniref:peptidoglycan-binding domain-containing protein n=1 Tax=Myxococcus guangdongensis TaxID=2906760 RepID=UPI0020A72AEC|nr:peptidoglycan-binding domain-containing protein [Myxococcus guangdongensis]MCP3064386.1 peptidoglycan-binding protein [Myxococcus guangdongensis]
MLNVGTRGSDVTRTQKALAKAGFNPGAADGIYGKQTQQAVKAFQKKHGLTQDGIVGNNTGRALFNSRNQDLWDGKPDGVKPGGNVPGNFPVNGSNRQKLDFAANLARQMGLTITSTTGGQHTPGSYHYKGRAIDVAGSPSKMAAFYDRLAGSKPTELFYDPRGGIKHGNNIGAIGGHRDHVHVAY